MAKKVEISLTSPFLLAVCGRKSMVLALDIGELIGQKGRFELIMVEEVKHLLEETRKIIGQLEVGDLIPRRQVLDHILCNSYNILRVCNRVLTENFPIEHNISTTPSKGNEIIYIVDMSPDKPIEPKKAITSNLTPEVLHGSFKFTFAQIPTFLDVIFNALSEEIAVAMPFGANNQYWTLLLLSFQGLRIQASDICELTGTNSRLSSINPIARELELSINKQIDEFDTQFTSMWLQWMETSFSLGTHRQDWQSYSPYMRNKRLSPSIVHPISLCRLQMVQIRNQLLEIPFLLSVSHRKRIEDYIVSKSFSMLDRTLLMILSTYARLPVSRTRLLQWQIDLVYLLYASLDSFVVLHNRSISPAMLEANPAINRIIYLLGYIDFLLCTTTTVYLKEVDSHIQADLLHKFTSIPPAVEPSVLLDTIRNEFVQILPTEQALFVYNRLFRRWYNMGNDDDTSTTYLDVVVSPQNRQCFHFSFDMLALMGPNKAEFTTHELPDIYRFPLLCPVEVELFQKEFVSAMQESHAAPSVAMPPSSTVVSDMNPAAIDPFERKGSPIMEGSASPVPPTEDTTSSVKKSVVITHKGDLAVLACREVLFARLMNCLQDLTAGLTLLAPENPDDEKERLPGCWTPILSTMLSSPINTSSSAPLDKIDLIRLLLHNQYRLLQYGGALEENPQEEAESKKTKETLFSRVMYSWIESIRIHRPELIEAVDGQQLFPPLTAVEKERIPMLMATFASSMI